MKKLFAIATLITGTLMMVSCGSDDGVTAAGEVAISGIPAASQIALGNDFVVSGVTITAESGIESFTVSVDGGAETDLTGELSGETSATLDVSLATTGLSLGLRTLVFTLTDVNGEDVSVQHGLTVAAFGIVEVDANITSDTEWTNDNVYVLAARVSVESGSTLTIEEGTIIKGQAGTGANATALVIARGASINAVGTSTQPIIFTSIADEIEPGEIASPNLDAEINGLWGGVIILGNAPISADAASVQIEGIPPSDQNGLYGGSTNNDNSGTFSYVSIRHGGSNIGEGNEINGLTLGGVGSATTISYIEVVGNQDDGIEWFGGTVDVTNAVVWNAGDDAIDTDQAWRGTLDNFAIIGGADTDHALEMDGPEGTDNDNAHTVTNGSVKGYIDTDDGTPTGAGTEMADLRSGLDASINNVYFFNFPDPLNAAGRGDFSISDCDQCTLATLQGTLNGSATIAETFKGISTAAASSVALGANTVGVDASVFANWTWADADGQLDDF